MLLQYECYRIYGRLTLSNCVTYLLTTNDFYILYEPRGATSCPHIPLYYISAIEWTICGSTTKLPLELLSIHCILIMNVHFHNDASFRAEKKKKKKRNQTVPKDDDNDAIEGDHSTKLSPTTTPTTQGLYYHEAPM